jgi:hypothetical protein
VGGEERDEDELVAELASSLNVNGFGSRCQRKDEELNDSGRSGWVSRIAGEGHRGSREAFGLHHTESTPASA